MWNQLPRLTQGSMRIHCNFGEYGDICIFIKIGRPTELTLHIVLDSLTLEIKHFTIHGFKIWDDRKCVDFKHEYGIEINAEDGR